VEIDWTWTAQESITLGLLGVALIAAVLLAYFRDWITRWWRRR